MSERHTDVRVKMTCSGLKNLLYVFFLFPAAFFPSPSKPVVFLPMGGLWNMNSILLLKMYSLNKIEGDCCD